MTKNIMNVIVFLYVTVFNIDAMTDLKPQLKKLENSSCTYDVGLGDENQIKWESHEPKALIKALKESTVQIDFKKQEMKFASYTYSMETAKKKFHIMRLNIDLENIPLSESIKFALKSLFFNQDIKDLEEVFIIDMLYRLNSINKKFNYQDAKCLWGLVSKRIKYNRKLFLKALRSGNISDLAKAVEGPLFIDQIDSDYIKQIIHKN